MKFDELRADIVPAQDSSFFVDGNVCANIEGSWYLNEEQVYVDSFDDAVSVIKEKIENNKEKYNSLIDESYSVEQALKIVRKYNNKVSQTILENCIETASSKQLTNDPAVLELRLEDTNLIADKYMFILDNKDVVALSGSDLLMLEKFDDELLQYGKQSAENLKQILRGIY